MRKRTLLAGAGLVLALSLLMVGRQQVSSDGADGAPAEDPATRSVPALAGGAPSPWPTGSVVEEGPPADFVPPPASALAYFDDRVMVRVDGDLDAVLADHGTQLLRQPGPSGYVALRVPDGTTADRFTAALAEDERVGFAGRVGRIAGASILSDQWHRPVAWSSSEPSGTASSAVVAVLDTGVNYQNGYDPTTGVYHKGASTLAYSTITAPYDFVDGDSKPYDDNMHGTHIASIIASDSSMSFAKGLARRASLMPIKVLDADNQGDEVTLLDGLAWAIGNGADVINMSLSFHDGYTPSGALKEALEEAWEAGIVMVAAAGNAAADQASWPARSPLVIGVAAYVGQTAATREPTFYTNTGTGVMITAPGGDMSVDLDNNYLPDGLLAQTITPIYPGMTAHFFMMGSSQAAATVSAAAAWYRDDGKDAWSTYVGLQADAATDLGGWADGLGAGRLSIPTSWSAHSSIAQTTHYVSLLPYLADNGDGTVTPAVALHVDEGSEAVDEVYVSFHGDVSAIASCTPDASGYCTVSSSALSDASSVVTWVTVDAVIQGGVSVPARTALYVSDAVHAALDMIATEVDADAALGFYWEDESDADLGELAAGMSVVNLSSSYATSPMGMIMNRVAMEELLAEAEHTVDLDGSGFASSPMGTTLVKLVDGSGFASSPMGSKKVALLAGSGFASSPMGTAFKTLGGSGGSRVALDGTTLASELVGTPVEDAVNGGAWSTSAGVALGDAIVAASMEAGLVDTMEASSTEEWLCYETGESSGVEAYSVESTDVYETSEDRYDTTGWGSTELMSY